MIKKVVNEDTLEIEEIVVEEESSNNETGNYYADKVMEALDCRPEDFFNKYRNYLIAEAEFKKLYDPFKEKLIDLYKELPNMPNSMSIGGVKLTYVSPSTRTSIDSKKLKEEEPEIAKKFSKITSVNATIRLGGLIASPDEL